MRIIRKGVSPVVSVPLYLGLVISAIIVIVAIGKPMNENFNDSIAIEQAKNHLRNLGYKIRDISIAENRTYSLIDLKFDRGVLNFNSSGNKIVYSLETSSDLVSSNVSKDLGNIVIDSESMGLSNGKEVSITLEFDGSNITDDLKIYSGVHTIKISNKGRNMIGINEVG